MDCIVSHVWEARILPLDHCRVNKCRGRDFRGDASIEDIILSNPGHSLERAVSLTGLDYRGVGVQRMSVVFKCCFA